MVQWVRVVRAAVTSGMGWLSWDQLQQVAIAHQWEQELGVPAPDEAAEAGHHVIVLGPIYLQVEQPVYIP